MEIAKQQLIQKLMCSFNISFYKPMNNLSCTAALILALVFNSREEADGKTK